MATVRGQRQPDALLQAAVLDGQGDPAVERAIDSLAGHEGDEPKAVGMVGLQAIDQVAVAECVLKAHAVAKDDVIEPAPGLGRLEHRQEWPDAGAGCEQPEIACRPWHFVQREQAAGAVGQPDLVAGLHGGEP
jgi:hypothetical protein